MKLSKIKSISKSIMTSTHADQGIDPSYPKPVSRHHDGSKPSNGFSHADSIEKGHSYTTFSHNLTIGPPSDSETNSNGSQIQTAAIGEIPFRRTISGLKPNVLAMVAFIGVASLLAIPLSILSTNFRHLRLGTVLVADFLLWLEVVWLSLACSNLIAKALAMIWSTVVKNTRLKAYKNVDRLQLPILLLAWVTIAWATITRICCDNNVACYETWVRTVERVLLATIAVSATIFLKRLLVYILWVSYASRYFSVKKYPKLSLDRNSEILFFLSSATTDFESKNWRSWLGEMQSDILNAVFEYKSEYGPPEDGPKILSNFGKGDGTAPEFETLSRSIWKRLNCAGRNSVSRSELEEHFRNVQDTYRKWRGKGSHKNVIRRIVEDARDGSIENPALEKLTCDKDISIEELLEVLDKDEDDVITFQEIQNFVTDVGVSLASFFKALNDMEQVVSFIDSILTFVLLFGVGLIYAAFFVDDLNKYLTPLWIAFTGLGFALSDAFARFLMACNFVFVQHPYDVGDWVDSKEGEWVVDSIHLTHSTYHTIDDKITGQISHVEAAKLTIKNKSRSPKVKEVIASEFRSNLPLIMDDNIRVYLEDSIRGILKSHPLSRFLDTKTFELAINLPEVVVVIYHKPTWMMETQRADCGAAFKKLFDIAIRNYVPPGPIKEQKSPSQAQYSPKTGPIEPRRHRSSDRAYKNESHSPRASSEPTNTDPVRHHHGSTHHSSHRPCSANASPVFRNIWENPSTVIRERPESNSPPRSSHPSPFSPSRPW